MLWKGIFPKCARCLSGVCCAFFLGKSDGAVTDRGSKLYLLVSAGAFSVKPVKLLFWGILSSVKEKRGKVQVLKCMMWFYFLCQDFKNHGEYLSEGEGIFWKQIVDLMLFTMVAACHHASY